MAAENAVVAKVNDRPITGYDISQRLALLRMTGSAGGGAAAQAKFQALIKSKATQERYKAFMIKNNPQSEAEAKQLQKKFLDMLRQQVMSDVQPGLRDKALSQLIVEAVEMEEANRLSITTDDEEVDQSFADIAQRNGKSAVEFSAILASQGVKPEVFKRRMKVQLTWQRVLTRKFRGLVNVGQAEIDAAVTTPAAASEDSAVAVEPVGFSLMLQRVVLPSTSGDGEAQQAARFEAADRLSKQAKGCTNLAALAKQVDGARFENLGKVSSDALPETVRGLLINAEAGAVTPPQPQDAGGLEIYAVCAKDAKAATDKARTQAKEKIENDKLQALAKGLVGNLCNDALIDMTDGSDGKRLCRLD